MIPAPGPKNLSVLPFASRHDDTGPVLDRGDPEVISVAEGEPLKAEMQRFADAVSSGADPLSGIDEALYVQRIMTRMQHAIDQGKAP